MTLIAAVQASTSLLVQIANPALRTLALAGAAGIGLAAFRVKAPSVRLFTWTAVLYVALAMPVLGWMLPALPIPMPAFLPDASLDHVAAQAVPNDIPTSQTLTAAPKPSAAREVLTARRKGAKGRSSAEIDGQTSHSSFAIQAPPNKALLAVVPAISPSSTRWSAIRWSAVSGAIYLAVASLFLLRLFVGIAFGRRLLRASRPIDETRLVQRLTFRAKSLRLAVIPDAAESEFISVPVTLGALRSTILLPAEWREWTTRSSMPSSRTKCHTWPGATGSHSGFPCCIAQSSGSARWRGGSTAISRTLRSRLATKPLCRVVAPTATITLGLCWDSSKPYRPRRDECGGRVLPWPRRARRNKDWNEFSPGKDRLP